MRSFVEKHPGLCLRFLSADLDERQVKCEREDELSMVIAREKANVLLSSVERSMFASKKAWLIACDQIVILNGKIAHKPRTEEEARERLERGGRAETRSALVCCDVESGYCAEALDVARVFVEPLPRQVVEQLLEEREVYGCAGGIMIEHPLVTPHVRILDGTLDSIMGLSLDTTKELMLDVAQACNWSR